MKRWAGIALLGLALLFALRVQLNLGGWPRFASRWLPGRTARGEPPRAFRSPGILPMIPPCPTA